MLFKDFAVYIDYIILRTLEILPSSNPNIIVDRQWVWVYIWVYSIVRTQLIPWQVTIEFHFIPFHILNCLIEIFFPSLHAQAIRRHSLAVVKLVTYMMPCTSLNESLFLMFYPQTPTKNWLILWFITKSTQINT